MFNFLVYRRGYYIRLRHQYPHLSRFERLHRAARWTFLGPPKVDLAQNERRSESGHLVGEKIRNSKQIKPPNQVSRSNPNPLQRVPLMPVPNEQNLNIGHGGKRHSDLTLLRDDNSEGEYWESQVIGGEEGADGLGVLPEYLDNTPDDVLSTMYDICSSYAQYPGLLASDGIDVFGDYIQDEDEFAIVPELTPQSQTLPGSAMKHGGQYGGLEGGNMSFGAFPSFIPSDLDPVTQSLAQPTIPVPLNAQEHSYRQSGGNSSTTTPNSDIHVFQDSIKLSDSGFFMTDLAAVPPVQGPSFTNEEGS